MECVMQIVESNRAGRGVQAPLAHNTYLSVPVPELEIPVTRDSYKELMRRLAEKRDNGQTRTRFAECRQTAGLYRAAVSSEVSSLSEGDAASDGDCESTTQSRSKQ